MSYHHNGLKAALLGTAAAALLALGAAATVVPANAADAGAQVRVSGKSPFAGCTADDLAGQAGTNYPNTEIEPWVDASPKDPRNLIAGWQQDRWSNGGARGLVAGVSKDGGRTWKSVAPPGISACTGGEYLRASDPWTAISPDGTAYFNSLALDPDPPTGGFGPNAILVNRSTDGGLTWGKPITLKSDTNPRFLNDKNSITADPTDSRFAYAVWDRLEDFSLPPEAKGGGARGARARVRFLRALAESGRGASAAEVFFKGPALLARTTNGGRSWEGAKEIYDPGGNAQTIGNQVVVTPSGTVIDFFNEIFPNGEYNVALLRSFNKGRTFEKKPTYIAHVASSFTATITPDEEAGVRDAAVLFDVAVDRRTGVLYAVWQDVRFRGVDEVAFSLSTDGGSRWTRPVRVNQTPAAGNRLRQQAFVPSVEVAPDGSVVVTYYDFRNDNGTGELTDHFAVVCKANCDSRASWGDELRLTRRSFDILDAPVAGGHFLGDYVGLVRAGEAVVPVYGVATGENLTDLFARRITFGVGPTAALGD